MSKDDVFKEKYTHSSDFKFTTKVAGVFDDMVNRSVPFYEEMQRMIAELAGNHARTNSNVYDLGCSTGTTLIQMDATVMDQVTFIGVDDSSAMLEKCETKLKEADFRHKYELQLSDLNSKVEISDASVVVLCLTLQFVRPINREKLIKQIYNGLKQDGVMIVIEKILAEDGVFNREFINYYYSMKRRNNYSELEISQKREALENVLIPYKLSENISLFRDAGFDHCEIFFKWYNFTGIIAKKLK